MHNIDAPVKPSELLVLEGYQSKSTILQFKPADLFGEVVCHRKDRLKSNPYYWHGRQRELEVHQSVQHPNILKLIDACQTPADIRFAYEWSDTKSLEELLMVQGKLPLDFAVYCCLQALEGVHALHKAGWLHYNLCLSSLYLCNDTVKVGQLHCCVRTGEAEDFGCSGRVFAVAPEVLQGGAFSIKSVVWSLGAALYQLLHGRVLFEAQDLETLVEKYANATAPPLAKTPENHYFEEVLSQMLELNPDKRIGLEGLLKLRRKLSASLDQLSPLKIFGVKHVLQTVADPTWIEIPEVRFTKELDPLKALIEESSAVNTSLFLEAEAQSKRKLRLSYMLVLSVVKFTFTCQHRYRLSSHSQLILALIQIARNLLARLCTREPLGLAPVDPERPKTSSSFEQEAAGLRSLSARIAKETGAASCDLPPELVASTVNEYNGVTQSDRCDNGASDRTGVARKRFEASRSARELAARRAGQRKGSINLLQTRPPVLAPALHRHAAAA